MAEAPPVDNSLERGIEIIVGLLILSLIVTRLTGVLAGWGISGGATFKKFDTVVTTAVTTVRDLPSGTVLGTQLAGARGVITDGPQLYENVRHWFVDFDTAPDGWVDEGKLSLTPEAISLGMSVRSIRSTQVHDAPSGSVIGTQPTNARGKVTQGPREQDGEVWWYVDYQTGTDGWVRASDLLPDEKETLLESIWRQLLAPILVPIWNGYATIAWFISFLLLTLVVYTMLRIKDLSDFDEARHNARPAELATPLHDPRFAHVESLAGSVNPSDWRQAILECDILLDELLARFGYTGNSVGDKLKQVRRGDLASLDSAWEAHKVRNDIAHRGSDFILTGREAKRVLALYRQVFEELGLFS